MKDVDVVDLFDEEINKQEKKLDKKVKKQQLKEQKKKEKEMKKLEHIEDQQFNDYLKKLKEETIVEVPVKTNEESIEDHINIKSVEKKLDENNIEEILSMKSEQVEKTHPFLNVLLVIFSICLLVISADYLVYNVITNYKDLETLINSCLLVSMVAFYLISIVVKSEGPKKFFQILSILSIIAFMAYHLFIA